MAKKKLSYKNLLVVESPAKAKTINKYLGKDFKVKATVGHIIDLPKSDLGVDIENGYEPEFTTIYGKAKVIKELKKAVPKDGNVYLAMDPDREGEAIAWHVKNALNLKDPKRVTFNEITKDAVLEAVENPSKIDDDLVEAQKARRVLDRLVGYKVTELIWKKIWYGLSAGRVQSPALRLIVEKEEEREAFNPEEYWKFSVIVKDEKKNELEAELKSKDGKKYIPSTGKEVEDLEKTLGDSNYKVVEVAEKEVNRRPYPPLTTSKMQQSANIVFGYTSKRTMSIAQALYQAGYITYMRTDSISMSSKAISEIRSLIEKEYGEKYLPKKPVYYKTKSKSAQEAHEAIRPTDFSVDKAQIKKELGSAHAKLYDLIWRRAVSSQMNPKKAKVLTVKISPKDVSKPEYIFSLGGEMILFDGFRKVLGGGKAQEDLAQISQIKEGDELKKVKFEKEQKFTQPPSRYTEASLVKALEKLGIGRPSTYATIISTIQSRGYVTKEGKSLLPTDVGRVVTNFLRNNFERLVDYEYTAKVEEQLDSISADEVQYVPFMESQYKPLLKEIEKADKEVEKEDVVILGKAKDEKCPECGGEMVIRVGRYGKFLSCAKFPDCKGMKDLSGGEESLDYDKYYKPEKCPKCGAKMVLKNGKYGKFWACEKYPDCKTTMPMLLNEKCPECGERLVERKGKWGKIFIGCSGYPDCKYIKKSKKKKKSEK
jgi:DNA topoisomerase-1